MKKETKKGARWLIILALPFMRTTPAVAQRDSLDAHTLNEVVITAAKFEKPTFETAKPVIVIDREMIEQHRGQDLAQVLSEEAWITVNGATSNPGKDKAVYLQGSLNAYTLILVDGVPLNDPSGFGGAYDLRLIHPDDVDHIEILPGSQSTLYGSDAVAGVINIITRQPPDGKMEGTLSARYGSYASGFVGAGVGGHAGPLGYRVNYAYKHTNGISEAAAPDNTVFEKDPSSSQYVNLSTELRIADSLILRPALRYTTFAGDYDAGAFADDVMDHYNGSLLQGGLDALWKINHGAIHFLYAYDDTRRKYEDSYGTTDYAGHFQNGDLFFNYDVGRYLQLLSGINYQDLTLAGAEGAVATLFSPYLSVFFRRISGFGLEAGVRTNRHSRYGNNTTVAFNPSWRFGDNVKLYYNYATGFKAPTLSQLFGPFGPNPDLAPERSRSHEGGIEALLIEKKLDVNLLLFDRKVRDIINYISPDGYINSGTFMGHGFEFRADLSLGSRSNLGVNYGYVDGELTSADGGESRSLIRIPRHTAGIYLSWRPAERWRLNSRLAYCGSRMDEYFDLSEFSSVRLQLDPYLLWNAHVAFEANRYLTVFMDLGNLLNSDYQESAGFSTLGRTAYLGVTFTP